MHKVEVVEVVEALKHGVLRPHPHSPLVSMTHKHSKKESEDEYFRASFLQLVLH